MTAELVSEALTAVLRAGGGALEGQIDRALALLIDQLGAVSAQVTEMRGGEPVVTYARSAPGSAPGPGAVISVPLPSGAVSVAARAPLSARDEITLHTVAAHVGTLLAERSPAPRAVCSPELATATGPLLRLLQQVTGLEGVYLNLFERDADEMVVTLAHETAGPGPGDGNANGNGNANGLGLGLAEGTPVAWDESLCRIAHRSGGVCEFPTGITTWMSVPVRDHEGRMIGTLCGGSRARVRIGEHGLSVAHSIAGLIADQLARDAAHSHRFDALRDSAERDSLTGLANRAGIHRWLGAALTGLEAGDQVLMLAFLDLDGFKSINDTYGHGVGDKILCGLGERLRALGRGDDLSGRLGGDEFVVAALLPAAADRQLWCGRVRAAAEARVGEVRAAASVGVAAFTRAPGSVTELLESADLAMYRDKQQRRDQLPGRFPDARTGARVSG